MTIVLDEQRIREIAGACQASSQAIEAEATKMNAQMQALEEAIQGPFHVALEDKFVQWKSLFGQLSEALNESNTFLNGIASSVDQMISNLQRS